MKKKINSRFMVVTAVAIIVTLVLSMVVFYEIFKEEVKDELKTATYILKNGEVAKSIQEGKFNDDIDNLRITLIGSDGTVVFDNNADIGDMDNHSDRPEVIEAFNKGEGSSVRKSPTLSKSTFYYALKLDDGSVLRAAKESGSIWSMFYKAVPLMTVIVVVLFGTCAVLSHMLTRSLVMPIERMASDIDNMNSVVVYKEIEPFINTIKTQHQDIMKNSKIRQEFTANVSHELKTPLTSISGYSELIENGMATESDIIRFAGEIHKNAKRLLTLINDIIRLSQLDSTDMIVQFEEIDLYKIAGDCVNLLQLNAHNSGLKLELNGYPSQIYANKGMMEEVVYNLCDNAMRYNNPGGSVNVSVYGKGDKVYLEVRDDGIGISKEHQERIFERFYRVDKSRSQSTGGTGLGLAIVKHIIVQHNAKMELESEEGKGTLIRAEFPRISLSK